MLPQIESIECTGAPRDLGLAQGRAFGQAVRDHVARSGGPLRRSRNPIPAIVNPWSSGSVLGAGPGREIIRHYPHLSERMAGLALGCDLPLESLMASLLAPAPSSATALTAPCVAVATQGLAARSFGLSPAPRCRWLLRHSHPEVGFASVELTLPWLPWGVAGVNSEGVAALVARSDPAEVSGAPPALLVQECLQRFASIDGCLDWCMKRNASGRATLFVADVSGDVAAVEFDADERRVIRPSDGLLSEGIGVDAQAQLRKALERHPDPPFDASSLDRLAAGAQPAADGERGSTGETDDVGRLIVRLEPATRRLIVEQIVSGSPRRSEFTAR